ncbi:hypothetical protein O7605_29735 [Verrucosispora sp. WMMA2121]|uniref:hypothetical protein n=1 Tax=Verrucosispora sp. WMMA2121 TaxID=3015164 RepID=UPI0022B73C09|nr:hypothetical protein [Verrucosispora sp. WMMA2121]MCZ7423697.1 hypothetical protein [Verrucosispora sp. WMMA2121]
MLRASLTHVRAVRPGPRHRPATGDALGLTWTDVDLDAGELTIGRQRHRVRGKLLHRDTKTQASDVCLAALNSFAHAASRAATQRPAEPAQVPPRDHPRLGGWSGIALDPSSIARLHTASTWAAHHLDRLAAIEQHGLNAAQGDPLVHRDLYPHSVRRAPGSDNRPENINVRLRFTRYEVGVR